MSEARVCENCGARPSKGEARFCEYCGTEFPPPEAPSEVRVEVGGPFGDLARRFRALEAHELFPECMEYTPPTTKPAVGMYGGAAFIGCFTIVAAFMTVLFGTLFLPLALVPLFMVVVGAVMLAKTLQKATRYSAAPLERRPAALLDERTEVSGGGENSSASTSYFATLQFPDGKRTEYAVDGRLAGALTRGDLGVAYLKSEVLVDFKRLEV